MSTFTASELYSTGQPRDIPSGAIVKSARITVAVTGTASSQIQWFKVPHGATITDYIWQMDDGGADNTWKLGIQYPLLDAGGSLSYTLTESALGGDTSSSAGTINRPQYGKLPYLVSISDNVTQRWAWVIATCAVAISASCTQQLTLVYSMDEIKP